MTYQLVEMEEQHISGVLLIERVSFPTPWSQQAFTYEISQNNFAYYLVALDENKEKKSLKIENTFSEIVSTDVLNNFYN